MKEETKRSAFKTKELAEDAKSKTPELKEATEPPSSEPSAAVDMPVLPPTDSAVGELSSGVDSNDQTENHSPFSMAPLEPITAAGSAAPSSAQVTLSQLSHKLLALNTSIKAALLALFVVLAFIVVNVQNPGSVLLGVRYASDYKGYEIQAQRAASGGKFDTMEEAYRLAIESAIASKLQPTTIAALYVRAGDAIRLRPDQQTLPTAPPTPSDNSTIGPGNSTFNTFFQSHFLASSYYKQAIDWYSKAGDKERESMALWRLVDVMDPRDHADLKQVHLRIIELGKGPTLETTGPDLIAAYNRLGQLEENRDKAKSYLEEAFRLGQAHSGRRSNQPVTSLNQPYVMDIPARPDYDSLAEIYKAEHDYKNFARVVKALLSDSSYNSFGFGDSGKRELELAYALRKIGNASEAMKWDEYVAAENKRNVGFSNSKPIDASF